MCTRRQIPFHPLVFINHLAIDRQIQLIVSLLDPEFGPSFDLDRPRALCVVEIPREEHLVLQVVKQHLAVVVISVLA